MTLSKPGTVEESALVMERFSNSWMDLREGYLQENGIVTNRPLKALSSAPSAASACCTAI